MESGWDRMQHRYLYSFPVASAHSLAVQVFWDNPLADFVELPTEYKDLKYSNILCGVIRGALESVTVVSHSKKLPRSSDGVDQHVRGV